MVNYYIKVTDEEPPQDEQALWVKIGDGEGEDDELFILKKNPYNEMYEDFLEVKDDLTSSSILSDAISTIMSDPNFRTENTVNATNIVDSENSNNKYNYSSLYNAINSKISGSDLDSSLNANSNNAVKNSAITSALNSSIDSLQSKLNQKSNTTHTHSGWNWVQIDNNVALMVNSALRLCFITVSYKNQKLTKGKTYSWAYSAGHTMYQYKPKMSVYLTTLNANQIAQFTTGCVLKYSSLQDGNQNLYFYGVYPY